MGAIFSTGKRRAPVEAESAASHPANFNPTGSPPAPPVGQPPLKRRRIDPHNDPIMPYYVPPSVPTKSAEAPDTPVTTSTPVPSSSRNLRIEQQQQQQQQPARYRRKKKRRFALFMGYNGENYFGMQINPGVVTIEQLLLNALKQADLISDVNATHPVKISMMRAARTDKGVSAAGQVVSLRLELEVSLLDDTVELTRRINQHLPDDIRVFGLLRVTTSFNARQDCHKRRYEYSFPLQLLGGPNDIRHKTPEDPESPDPRVTKFTDILKNYEGSHCFANFTERLDAHSDAARRYMISVRCLPPFLPPGAGRYYVTVEVIGQSFMLHQIRKMVGLALVIYHGHAPMESMSVAMCPDVRFPTPMAPAEGLLLDTLYFEQYNRRYESELGYEVGDKCFNDSKRAFKMHQIYRRLAEKEAKERTLETWVRTCKSRMPYSYDYIMGLHKKYVLTDLGKRELREKYKASLYRIQSDVDVFLDCSEDSDARRKLEDLRSKFTSHYGHAPTFFVRAPGRVILIGEHLDYNGFPVISAALQQGTTIAGSQDEDSEKVDVTHAEKESYRGFCMDVNGKPIRGDNDDGSSEERWMRYVSSGFRALSRHNDYKRLASGGGDLMIAGDLPRAGGLASSSSLVSASVLACARLGRTRMPREELAAVAANGERGGVKTSGGSVDHVTSLCAEKGRCLHVSFVPKVEVDTIKIPDYIKIFVVNSRIIAEKGGNEDIRKRFNLRAAECRVAAAVVARRLDVHLAKAVSTPGQLYFNACKTGRLECKDVGRMTEMVHEVMKVDEVLSVLQAKELLGVNEIELRNRFLVNLNVPEIEGLRVGKRLWHVMDEACRVEKFTQVIKDECLTPGEKIEQLGHVLNEGHESLRTLFQSSVDEVNMVVQACRDAGAAGSRMTGAGWGGYIVNIVNTEKAKEFVLKIAEKVGMGCVQEVDAWSGGSVLVVPPACDPRKNRIRRPQ